MFSRDCVNCDTASVASQMSNPYGTPRLGLGTLPQDMMRYQGSSASMRRDATNPTARPLHSNLSRLRCGADKRPNRTAETSSSYRHEDPSYENVHVQWQNGFEFGRSREYDGNYNQQRPLLQRARSESPTFSNQQRRMQRAAAQAQAQAQSHNAQHSAKLADPFKGYELNVDNNSFKPKQPTAMEMCDELEGAVGGAAAESDAEQTLENLNASDNETETTTTTTTSASTTTAMPAAAATATPTATNNANAATSNDAND